MEWDTPEWEVLGITEAEYYKRQVVQLQKQLAALSWARWVSVERLPSDHVGKLVMREDGSIWRMYFHHSKKVWVSQCGDEYTDVTHWMPLPPPVVQSP